MQMHMKNDQKKNTKFKAHYSQLNFVVFSYEFCAHFENSRIASENTSANTHSWQWVDSQNICLCLSSDCEFRITCSTEQHSTTLSCNKQSLLSTQHLKISEIAFAAIRIHVQPLFTMLFYVCKVGIALLVKLLTFLQLVVPLFISIGTFRFSFHSALALSCDFYWPQCFWQFCTRTEF